MDSLAQRAGFESLAGKFIRRIRRRQRIRCVNILTYQCISPMERFWSAGRGSRHDPADFERQMDYIVEHYKPMRLRDFAECAARKETPERAVIITVDGGTADTLAVAAPILYRRRIPATIFAATCTIGNEDLLWQHKVAWLDRAGKADTLISAMQAAKYPSPSEHESAVDYVRRCYRADTQSLIEETLIAAGTSGARLAAKYRPYLTPGEMAGADPEFIEFGNYTHTCPVLASLTEEQQRAEITTAQQMLTSICGRAPMAFAYPFGLLRSYNEASQRIAAQTGHRVILDMRRRINRPGASLLDLSRKPAPVDSPSEFEMLLEDWPHNAAVDG